MEKSDNAGRPGDESPMTRKQWRDRLQIGKPAREVAMLLKISERGVRTIERHALRKLAQHPQLREIWSSYLAGEISEPAHHLSRTPNRKSKLNR
jgi:hypothetical protein